MQVLEHPVMEAAEVENPDSSPQAVQADDFEGEVLQGSLTALVRAGALTPAEEAGFSKYLTSNNLPVSRLLPLMAELRKIEEDRWPEFVEGWGRGMAISIKKRYSLVPFAARLLNPASFYEQFDQIHRWAKQMRVPVIFAEDADVVGLGCVNPVACEAVASRVSDFLFARMGNRPFISKVLLDYETWDLVCRKHFEL